MQSLLTLWEIMAEFDGAEFIGCFGRLQDLQTRLQKRAGEGPAMARQQMLDHAGGLLERIQKFCKSIDRDADEFNHSYLAASSVLTAIKNHHGGMDVSALQTELRHVIEGMLRDAAGHRFAYIPGSLARHYDNDIFGRAVKDYFSERAGIDMKEAGTCLALGNNTAAVFHLMRVAEHGLRVVARKLRVTLTRKGANQPIEFADWNDVITGIRNKISVTRQLPRGPRKERNLQFYSDVADQCEYIKDIWRNTISHTRRPYGPDDALYIFTRVRGFMNTIAVDMGKAK